MNIEDLASRFYGLRIAVVGDKITDRYIDGEIDRISPEAPVPVLRITGTRENPGGAGNVVENLKGLGVAVSFFHDFNNVIIKTRVMSGTHHILRMDDEDAPKWMNYDDVDFNLGYGISHKKFQCVVISDYGKGMCSKDVVSNVLRQCLDNQIPVVVDTKNQIGWMHHATTVKCNHKEWEAYKKTRVAESTWDFLQSHCVRNLVVTSGSSGMKHWTKVDDGDELSGNIPGIETHICDPCGAGDTVTAVLACMEALGEPIDDACELANIAAAEVCRHPGVYAIQKQDLLKYGK